MKRHAAVGFLILLFNAWSSTNKIPFTFIVLGWQTKSQRPVSHTSANKTKNYLHGLIPPVLSEKVCFVRVIAYHKNVSLKLNSPSGYSQKVSLFERSETEDRMMSLLHVCKKREMLATAHQPAHSSSPD